MSAKAEERHRRAVDEDRRRKNQGWRRMGLTTGVLAARVGDFYVVSTEAHRGTDLGPLMNLISIRHQFIRDHGLLSPSSVAGQSKGNARDQGKGKGKDRDKGKGKGKDQPPEAIREVRPGYPPEACVVLRPSQMWACYKVLQSKWEEAWADHIKTSLQHFGSHERQRRLQSMFESWLFDKMGGKLLAKILIACEEVAPAHLEAAKVEIRLRAPGSSTYERERAPPEPPARQAKGSGKNLPHMRWSRWAQRTAELPEEQRCEIEAGSLAPPWYNSEVGARGQQLAAATEMKKYDA